MIGSLVLKDMSKQSILNGMATKRFMNLRIVTLIRKR